MFQENKPPIEQTTIFGTYLYPVISALVTSIIAAFVAYFLSRKKLNAEVKKMEAETQTILSEGKRKLEAEIKKLDAETQAILTDNKRKTEAEITKINAEAKKALLEVSNAELNLSANISYKLSSEGEKIIYSSKNRDIGYDFTGVASHRYELVGDNYEKTGDRADGNLVIKDGVINIQRNNTDGRFEVWLKTYFINGQLREHISKNELESGRRNIRVSFEAKVTKGNHNLRILFKDKNADRFLAFAEKEISSEHWEAINLYFEISRSEECKFRIDDRGVSNAPSSVQIRNIEIAEKITN
jgi:hypothetical protein